MIQEPIHRTIPPPIPWSNITGKPTQFPPETHKHSWADLPGPQFGSIISTERPIIYLGPEEDFEKVKAILEEDASGLNNNLDAYHYFQHLIIMMKDGVLYFLTGLMLYRERANHWVVSKWGFKLYQEGDSGLWILGYLNPENVNISK